MLDDGSISLMASGCLIWPLHTSGITGYDLASHSGILAMASPVAANIQICKYAKKQRAGSAGQKGSATRAAALYPTLLYTLSKSNRTHGQWDGQRVTDLSPSAVRCHRRGLEHKIRYETGWWLGYLTISGLGTLTALQITSNFAGDCSTLVVPLSLLISSICNSL